MKTESESQSTLNTETMCRLCLCQSGDENSVEIFFTNDLSLTVRIMACAGLEVCWLFIILDDQHDLNVLIIIVMKKKTQTIWILI